jgi:hypothetical protein
MAWARTGVVARVIARASIEARAIDERFDLLDIVLTPFEVGF